MNIEIDQAHQDVVAAAIAAGHAANAQDFVNGLIDRYRREPKTQAQIEAMLIAADQGQYIDMVDVEQTKADTLDAYRSGIRRQGA